MTSTERKKINLYLSTSHKLLSELRLSAVVVAFWHSNRGLHYIHSLNQIWEDIYGLCCNACALLGAWCIRGSGKSPVPPHSVDKIWFSSSIVYNHLGVRLWLICTPYVSIIMYFLFCLIYWLYTSFIVFFPFEDSKSIHKYNMELHSWLPDKYLLSF